MRTVLKILSSMAATVLIAVLVLAAVACGQESAELARSDVSPTLPEDVAVDVLPKAPDFTLPAANRGSTEISLSSFQGDKEVVLVFYRAYW